MGMQTPETALAELAGSPKQIAWATEIRGRMFTGWNELLDIDLTAGVPGVNYDTGLFDAAKLAQALVAKYPTETTAALAKLTAETTASYWIDHRGSSAADYKKQLPIVIRDEIRAALAVAGTHCLHGAPLGECPAVQKGNTECLK